jgi:DNA modification methylase
MCGDSTKAEDVAKLMQGEQADLWLTDPPYNVDYSAAKNRTNIVAGHDSNRKSIENDTMSDEDFQTFLDNVFKAADNVMRLGCSFYIWHSHTIASKIEAALAKCGLQAKQQLIWNKNSIVLGWLDYKQKHEPCFYGYKGGVNDHYFIKTFDKPTVIEDGTEIDIDKMKKDEMKALLHEIFDSKIPTTVINEKRPTTAKEHPTMKPVRLFGRLMQNSSRQHDIILDTFGGSGTTIVAAEQLDRKARLMELDPHYCDVIIARWEKLTGQKAIKLNQSKRNEQCLKK